MKNYLDLMKKILDEGEEDNTERTGIGTLCLFGETLKFDLRNGFPAVTTKKLAWKAVVSELLWFIKGSTNLRDLREILHGKEHRLNEDKKTIWDDNYYNQAVEMGYENGEMGDLYGAGWRNFGKGKVWDYNSIDEEFELSEVKGIDQFKIILEEASKNPSSRRLLVNAWNPRVIWDNKQDDFFSDPAALPPCHYAFQINIKGDYIDLMWSQRSVDYFLGLGFNIASYAILLHIFARLLGKTPRNLIAQLGIVHIYKNHVDQCHEQLSRTPYDSPTIWINPNLKTLEDFENASVDDFKLENYNHHAQIKAKMAV